MKPKILFFDVETAPVRAWIWRTGYKINVSHEQIFDGDKHDIICLAWKWAGSPEVHSLDWGIKKQDSSAMIAEFSKVIESADLAIGHNIDQFDMKQINTQRLMHNQPPIAWPTTEDTLKQYRKHFAFPSYKLDYIAKTLVGAGKDRMTFKDWIDIVQYKDVDALAKMIKYCKKDVRLLERIFNRAKIHFKPKISSSIIMGNGKFGCARCGSLKREKMGFLITKAARRQRFRCLGCGSTYSLPLTS